MRDEILHLGHDDLLRIAGAESGLDHGSGVHVDLNGGLAAAESTLAMQPTLRDRTPEQHPIEHADRPLDNMLDEEISISAFGGKTLSRRSGACST